MRCKRFLAGSRCKLWWMAPAWCDLSRPRLPFHHRQFHRTLSVRFAYGRVDANEMQ